MGKIEVIEVLEKLRKEQDVTIILVDHRSDEILKYADRVILLNEGKMELNESPDKFFRHIDFLKERGVYPPQVAQFAQKVFEDPAFIKMGLTPEDLPLTVDEGLAFIKKVIKNMKGE